MNAIGYSTHEFMACVLARLLVDEEVGIIGTMSDIGYAACRLAQATSAPGLWCVSGPSGVVNPSATSISPIAGYDLIERAEALADLTDNLDAIDWSSRIFDFAILGGMQVDRFGNINTVTIGSWERPVVRGPGAIGASVLAANCRHHFILMTNHSCRSFVPEVDFISALGYGRTGNERTALNLPGGGPDALVSPLGLFDFHPQTRELRVRALMPSVSAEEVRANTGFDLNFPADATPILQAPTRDELAVIRQSIDRSGKLSAPGV